MSLWSQLRKPVKPVEAGAHLRLGRCGEDAARSELERLGMKILCANYRHGRGEIDLIARDGEVLAFVEVKSLVVGELGASGPSGGAAEAAQAVRHGPGLPQRTRPASSRLPLRHRRGSLCRCRGPRSAAHPQCVPVGRRADVPLKPLRFSGPGEGIPSRDAERPPVRPRSGASSRTR